MPTARRFLPPWTAEVTPNCFIVRDANGQALSYVYYECEPERRSAAKLLSKDGERRIAAPSGEPKFVATLWAPKDANFAVATRPWYDTH